MKISHFLIDSVQKNLIIKATNGEEEISQSLSFEYLRVSSPENANSKKPTLICHKKNVQLLNIESVAKYGYRLIFDDDHSTIYSEDDIHTLIVEHDSRWESYLSAIKTSGHSREGMIDIKQV